MDLFLWICYMNLFQQDLFFKYIDLFSSICFTDLFFRVDHAEGVTNFCFLFLKPSWAFFKNQPPGWNFFSNREPSGLCILNFWRLPCSLLRVAFELFVGGHQEGEHFRMRFAPARVACEGPFFACENVRVTCEISWLSCEMWTVACESAFSACEWICFFACGSHANRMQYSYNSHVNNNEYIIIWPQK